MFYRPPGKQRGSTVWSRSMHSAARQVASLVSGLRRGRTGLSPPMSSVPPPEQQVVFETMKDVWGEMEHHTVRVRARASVGGTCGNAAQPEELRTTAGAVSPSHYHKSQVRAIAMWATTTCMPRVWLEMIIDIARRGKLWTRRVGRSLAGRIRSELLSLVPRCSGLYQ